MDWLHVTYYVILVVILVVGLMINVLGLPGLWLMLGSLAIYTWVTGVAYISWKWILILVGIALLAELFEFLAAGAGAKKAGGSKRGMVGAIIGGLLGGLFLSIPFPVVGTIIGVCIGTFAGAWIVEVMIGKRLGHSTRIGWGAAVGRLYGTLIKLAFGGVIFLLSLWQAFPIANSLPALPPATAPATLPSTAPATSTAPAELPA